MNSRTDTRSYGHIPSLDGVRGVAIALVLLCHLFFAEQTGVPAIDVLYRAASAGWVGVDLFFVLSGFLITGILIEARQDYSGSNGIQHYFGGFYARRTLRIFPLYYGMLIVALVLTLTVGRGNAADPEGFFHAQAWLWTFTANVPMAVANHFVLFKAWHLTFSPFWSLAVEEQFYLFWPLVVWLCGPRHLLKLAAGLAVASAIARIIYVQMTGREITAYVFSPFRLDGLLLGAVCAVIVRSSALTEKARRFLPVFLISWLAAVLLIFYLTSWQQANRFVSGIGFTILDAGFAGVILACVTGRGLIRSFAEHRALRLLGKYSYGLYVLHLLVLAPMLNTTSGFYGHLVHHSVWTELAVKPFAAIAAVAVAAASWHFYEQRFMRLKRFFQYPKIRQVVVADHVPTAAAGSI